MRKCDCAQSKSSAEHNWRDARATTFGILGFVVRHYRLTLAIQLPRESPMRDEAIARASAVPRLAADAGWFHFGCVSSQNLWHQSPNCAL